MCIRGALDKQLRCDRKITKKNKTTKIDSESRPQLELYDFIRDLLRPHLVEFLDDLENVWSSTWFLRPTPRNKVPKFVVQSLHDVPWLFLGTLRTLSSFQFLEDGEWLFNIPERFFACHYLGCHKDVQDGNWGQSTARKTLFCNDNNDWRYLEDCHSQWVYIGFRGM